MAAFDRLINAPLIPMRSVGGLDLAKEDWSFATKEDAERTLCQSAPNETSDKTIESRAWGLAPNPQLIVDFDKGTGKVRGWELHSGYRGKLSMKSRPSALGDPARPNPFGEHAFSIGLDAQIQKDGAPHEIHWLDDCRPDNRPGDACWQLELTELYDAAMATFAPELPSTQGNCVTERLCLGSKAAADVALFGVRPLGTYMVFNNYRTQPAASTPAYFYGIAVKSMPFSSGDVLARLGGEGFTLKTGPLGDRGQTCTMKPGMAFEQLLASCVEVQSSAAANAALRAKLLGGGAKVMVTTAAGPAGRWELQAAGYSPSFEAIRFDEREPLPSATLKGLTLDTRSGRVLNDIGPDGVTHTLTGTAAVYRGYVRFLHATLREMGLAKLDLGAPECLMKRGDDPKTWQPEFGCTGLEQMLTPGEAATSFDPALQRVSASDDWFWRTVLKPATLPARFCADLPPNPFGKDGFDATCTADQECRSGTCEPEDAFGKRRCARARNLFYQRCGDESFLSQLWPDTRRQLELVLGNGSLDGLAELRDPAFYLRAWAKALVGYLLVAHQGATDITAGPSDAEIVIESADGDLFEVRYLDRFSFRARWSTGSVETMTFR
jgi:hypothetical protein